MRSRSISRLLDQKEIVAASLLLRVGSSVALQQHLSLFGALVALPLIGGNKALPSLSLVEDGADSRCSRKSWPCSSQLSFGVATPSEDPPTSSTGGSESGSAHGGDGQTGAQSGATPPSHGADGPKRRGFSPRGEKYDLEYVLDETARKPPQPIEEPKKREEQIRPQTFFEPKLTALQRRAALEKARNEVRVVRMKAKPEMYDREDWQEVDHSVTLEMFLKSVGFISIILTVIAGYLAGVWYFHVVFWFFAFE